MSRWISLSNIIYFKCSLASVTQCQHSNWDTNINSCGNKSCSQSKDKPAINICAQVLQGFSHGCREARAAGGQCGERHHLPEAGAPGHVDWPAAGDHTPEEALSWSVYRWTALAIQLCASWSYIFLCAGLLYYCFSCLQSWAVSWTPGFPTETQQVRNYKPLLSKGKMIYERCWNFISQL